MSPHLIGGSTRRATRSGPEVKKVAYLIDETALDLATGITEATISHEAKVDWMEMNGRATKLLFRDKRRASTCTISRRRRSTLLSFSSYVQWVPNADVVVAQNRSNLCIWYPHRHARARDGGDQGRRRGDRRGGGSTQVVVDEGWAR